MGRITASPLLGIRVRGDEEATCGSTDDEHDAAIRQLTAMLDKIIDAVGAQERQAFAVLSRRLWGWIIMQDQPDYPGKVIARLCIEIPTPFLLVADTLDEIPSALPPDLVRTERQPADERGVLEIWFPA